MYYSFTLNKNHPSYDTVIQHIYSQPSGTPLLDYSQSIMVLKGNGESLEKAELTDDVETHVYYYDESRQLSQKALENLWLKMILCLRKYATHNAQFNRKYKTSCLIGSITHFYCDKNPDDNKDEWQWSDDYILNVLKDILWVGHLTQRAAQREENV